MEDRGLESIGRDLSFPPLMEEVVTCPGRVGWAEQGGQGGHLTSRASQLICSGVQVSCALL